MPDRESSSHLPRWTLAALALTLAGCATTTPPAPPAGPTVAVVSGRAISADALRAEMGRRGGQVPGQYQTVEQRRALLDEMVADVAIAERARREGLADDPEFRAAIERMLIQRYERAHLEPRLAAVAASEEEIAAYYAAHQPEYSLPARARAAWVFVDVPKKADAAKVAELERRAEKARAAALALPAETASFGTVALEYSDDPATRYTGGEIGWVHVGQGEAYRYGPEVLEAALALATPGEVSPVLRTEHGFALVRLMAREAAAPAPLDKLRPGIRNLLLREKRETIRREFQQQALAGFDVRIDENALAAIAPLAPAEVPQAPPPLPAD